MVYYLYFVIPYMGRQGESGETRESRDIWDYGILFIFRDSLLGETRGVRGDKGV